MFSTSDFITYYEPEINEIFDEIEMIEGAPINRSRITKAVVEVLNENGAENLSEIEILSLFERTAVYSYGLKAQNGHSKQTLKRRLHQELKKDVYSMPETYRK